jgi:uncharacterized protein DUF1801
MPRSSAGGKSGQAGQPGKAPPAELLEFLYPYGPAIQSLVLGLRQVVLDELAPCHEYIFTMRSRVVLLYAATERILADGICLISPFAKHVNLGFHHGADLKDDRGMLEGSGKAMRHIKLRALAELDQPELRVYLRQARRDAGAKPPKRGEPRDVVTRVKRPSPSKQIWPRLF